MLYESKYYASLYILYRNASFDGGYICTALQSIHQCVYVSSSSKEDELFKIIVSCYDQGSLKMTFHNGTCTVEYHVESGLGHSYHSACNVVTNIVTILYLLT